MILESFATAAGVLGARQLARSAILRGPCAPRVPHADKLIDLLAWAFDDRRAPHGAAA